MFGKPKASVDRHHVRTQGRCGGAYRARGRSGTRNPIDHAGVMRRIHRCVVIRRFIASRLRAQGSRAPQNRNDGARKAVSPNAGGERNAGGAPGRGAAAQPTSGLATKRAPSLSASGSPGLPDWPGPTRLPRLVARGYLAAVPGRCCVRTTFLRRNRRHEKPHRVTNS